jgi:hypothetical protein
MLNQILKAVPSLKAPSFVWRSAVGEKQFMPFSRAWLSPIPDRLYSHSCTLCGENHKVVFHSETDIVSVPPKDSYCERKQLSPDDASVYEFNEQQFAEHLCKVFSIEQNLESRGECGLLRVGWIGGSVHQYPVYLLLRNSFLAEAVCKSLLLEEETPFVLFVCKNIPSLAKKYAKKKCALFSLDRVVGLTPKKLNAISTTGIALFADFIRDVAGSVYIPAADIQILGDFNRIQFPDGYTVNLKPAHTRRAVVRFIYEWVKKKNDPVFDQEDVRDAYNKQHSDKPWKSDRLREDLFKNQLEDFDRLFQILDAANQRFRLKI